MAACKYVSNLCHLWLLCFITCTQAQRIAENALNVFENLEQVRLTKSSIFGYIMGQLLAKSACVEAELALMGQDCDEALLAACQVCKHCMRFISWKSVSPY